MQLEDEIPPLRASLADAHDQLKQHRRKIGDLSARLLRAETALIDKAEQAEVNALAEATRRFMAKTGQTLVRPKTHLPDAASESSVLFPENIPSLTRNRWWVRRRMRR